MNCLFCNIVNGSIPAKIIYEDPLVIAFDDVNPQAPEHKIIIPREHITTLNEATHETHRQLLGHWLQSTIMLAKQLNLADNGYRLVMNCNPNGGQTVFHIHAHLLGGRQMSWPPG